MQAWILSENLFSLCAALETRSSPFAKNTSASSRVQLHIQSLHLGSISANLPTRVAADISTQLQALFKQSVTQSAAWSRERRSSVLQPIVSETARNKSLREELQGSFIVVESSKERKDMPDRMDLKAL